MAQASANIDSLFEQARSLEADDRALLAHWLIDSLIEDNLEKEPGYDEYWEAELERQKQEFEEGRAELVEWDDAMEQIFGQQSE